MLLETRSHYGYDTTVYRFDPVVALGGNNPCGFTLGDDTVLVVDAAEECRIE